MRNTLSITFAACMSLAVAGCGDDGDTSTSSASADASATDTTPSDTDPTDTDPGTTTSESTTDPSTGTTTGGGVQMQCDYPVVFQDSRLVYGCDIDNANCRYFSPKFMEEPLCGDEGDQTIKFVRDNNDPNSHSFEVVSPWTISEWSQGSITLADRKLFMLPDDMPITATIDNGAGLSIEIAFQFTSADMGTTITSVTVL